MTCWRDDERAFTSGMAAIAAITVMSFVPENILAT